MLHVLAKVIGQGNVARVSRGYVPRPIGDESLDAILEPAAVLDAGAREYFDAVVLIGIVRCRNHDAGIEIERSGQVRDCRCRRDADAVHRGSRRAGAVRQLPLNPHTRFPRIPPDEKLGRGMRKRFDQCGADAADGGCIQGKCACRSSDSISAEKCMSHSR